ncbi:MAG: hypothetical protein LQ342_001501 [Letrouitia transgressa]|nr:MAG: hypothetical protein LQ342_001501 [Letrouitia transgressa]
MNQHPQYMDSQQSHISTAQPYAPQPSTAGSMQPYSQYQHQPPVMHPTTTYAPSPSGYGQYGYGNGVTSPHGTQPVSSSMGPQMNSGMLPALPAMPATGPPQHGYVGAPGAPPQQQYHMNDTTGQVAPPGMKPRVTATLWEDEGSMCFQVEAKGVCVARRDGMDLEICSILLNVAGMTRGRRDGILKSEKMRHVVKIGPMHLKGVWIPFDRALDFANKEKITESLYPLFVHNIGALLYHPTNSNRTNAVMAAAERRKLDGSKSQPGALVGAPGSQPPPLHHHHSMNTSHVSQSPHSIAPHPSAGRPNLDRAHTFPTPPTSASSGIGMGTQSTPYTDWSQQNMNSGTQNSVVESHAHSTPNTPAATPPIPNMPPYQSQQSYDSKSVYPASSAQQPQYAPQQSVQQNNMAHYGTVGPSPYMKREMGPPTSRITEIESDDHKPDNYSHGQGNGPMGHGTGEEEADHEHDSEYPHDNNTAYNTTRSTYHYTAGSNLGSLQGEHPHLSPEMTGSPSHQNGSGRLTPRNSASSQPQWTAGHQTPPRTTYSSNAYNPISDARGSAPNGTANVDSYGTSSLASSYAPSHVNGAPLSNKRPIEDDDQEYGSRPASRGDDIDGIKRRKLGREGSVSGAVSGNSFDRDGRPINRTQNRPVQRIRRS